MNAIKNKKIHHILILFIIIVVFIVIFYNNKGKYENRNKEVFQLKKQDTISFNAQDSLNITADLYLSHKLTSPFIILFHQAGWSRGEYKEIAPILNNMGFNCLAIDQRSGGEINEIKNQTFLNAEKEKKSTNYIDAYQDMEAALSFVKTNYAKGKIIVWGSSYSASLVIKLVSENIEIIDGILAFAPGEYFSELGKSETFITEAAKKVKCPIFITSAKSEKNSWEMIFHVIPSEFKHSFLPETVGNHGSRALWQQYDDSKDYWNAVNEFLKKYFVE